jgi:hypothetical protein
VKIREVREVSRPGSPLQVHEITLDSEDRAALSIRDIPGEQWIAPSPEPVSRIEVVATAFFVSVLVNLLVGLVALVAMAALAWSLP